MKNEYLAEDIAYQLFMQEDTSWVASPDDMAKAILNFLNKRDQEERELFKCDEAED